MSPPRSGGAKGELLQSQSQRGEAQSRGQTKGLPSQHRPVTPSKAVAQPGRTSTITLACGCWVFIRRTMASIPPATSSAVFSWLFVPTQTTMTCKEREKKCLQLFQSRLMTLKSLHKHHLWPESCRESWAPECPGAGTDSCSQRRHLCQACSCR